MSHQSENCRSVSACVISTPLGAPVVPDVKSTSLTSSGCTASQRASTSAAVTASPARRNPSNEQSAGAASSKPTTCTRSGSSARSPASVAA